MAIMRHTCTCLLLVFALAPFKSTQAEEPQPTAAQIKQWVVDLDGDQFTTRDEATKRLIAAGKVAIDPVTEAACGKSAEASNRAIQILAELFKSADVEIKSAAKAALEKLAKDENTNVAKKAAEIVAPKPEPAQAPQFGPFGGVIQIMVKHNANGVRVIEANEPGKKVKIVDDPNKGITVEVTEKANGQDKTNKYEAKDADELKKKHPEAEKLYQQYAGKNARGIQIPPLPPFPPGVLPPGFAPAIPLIPGQLPNEEATKKLGTARKRLQELTEQLEKQAGEKHNDESLKKLAEELKKVDDELNEVEGQLQP